MAKSGNVFDIDRLHQYVEFMKENDITEIDLEQNGEKIRLSRSGATMPVAASAPAPAASSPAAPIDEEVDESHIVTINSPMVGTFYERPNPESDPYIKVGDMVTAESTVCIIEAMKVFNELQAEVRGKIVAVLVDDQSPVDVGKPLFKVDTSV
ncbi:MAG: acetyl-CoA carboxylase biotin carboxyl carrier protein [Planctomycetota bacterium]|nr:acetyl-CoA carboxylase biotin carboxyl carrier protein [Planctomycetota bacterium]